MHVCDFEVTLPDTFSWKEHVKKIQREGSLYVEGMQRRKDGTIFPVEVNVNLLKYGTKSHVIAIARDITDRKRSEEISIENERLVYASKAKNEFLSKMSHELRTPLNAVIGFSELLKMKSLGNLTEKQESYVDNIRYGGKHLLNIITDILDLSKIDAGKMELVIENISVPETINQTLVMVEETAKKNNVRLIKELSPELEFIEVDMQRFIQILFNLLSNAIKFNRKMGGTVTVITKIEGYMAKFSVSDTGIGIKEEDKNRLFKDFEQLDSGITRKYVGAGLGLAITKKLVELHGGKIWVDSEFGVGSTFTFLLPIMTNKG
jgi:signal transduction histidine kinase